MGFGARVRSEFAYLSGALRALRRTGKIRRAPNRTWPDAVEDLARRYGDRPALISERETLSYRDYDQRANRYARFFRAQGIGKGDCVALMMPNRPEYLAVWLGVARAGGVTALLNTHQRGAALAHSVAIVAPKLAIVDAALIDAWDSAAEPLAEQGAPPLPAFVHGEAGERPRVDRLIEAFPDGPLAPAERTPLTIEDRCLYIYTSGTTGLPKAANINHYRVQAIMAAFAAATNATESDRIYVCLPLYHSAGGVLAVGIALTTGGSAVIAERFSASRFWDDVVDYDCTMVQYIGELCRYLLNSPPHPKERAHGLRIIDGNGLRPDVWRPFQRRFAIPRILEWYAATEGNALLLNFDETVGAVGRLPWWAKFRFPLEVVRFDEATEQPVRGPDGRCIKCAPGEVGELVSQILDDPKKPAQRFEGYADRAATSKKIVTDAFRPGDRWFRTGDLMRRDRHGYFFFVDRIGDTFRRRGENVSTVEVAALLGAVPGVTAACVYGVEMAGEEGKAGMAALVVAPPFSLEDFARAVEAGLPDYARPVFVRLCPALPETGTHKLTKLALVHEGFDPAVVGDPLFMRVDGAYVPLDAARFSTLGVRHPPARGETP
ncbi:long-chain-acyl-CoA synthetase [Pseudoxanthobacter sp. M-2]|uniref:long-chain-acyl-CoA synthetase n=1 Tax=Pseudoxanthobacter sp. M-2 TaxID=3078754 RepID=UPI0038FC19B8